MKSQELLRVSEIFASLQGESTTVGVPTVFVRLTGCPLRCRWCDTTYAFRGGERLTIDEILARVSDLGLPEVCVTGGEPLAQAACRELLATLADAGHRVSLETSGALSIAGLDPRVRCVMDLKAPGSGEADKNLWDNLDHLRPHDEVKFVLTGREDYLFALDVARRVWERNTVHFSPVAGALDPAELAAWMVADRVRARLGLQLHKYIWSPDARGV